MQAFTPMADLVLFERMMLSQISQGMLETTLILIDPIVLLIGVSKNTQVLTKQTPRC